MDDPKEMALKEELYVLLVIVYLHIKERMLDIERRA